MQYLFASCTDSNSSVTRYSGQGPEDVVLGSVLRSKISTSVNSLRQQRNFPGDCHTQHSCMTLLQKETKGKKVLFLMGKLLQSIEFKNLKIICNMKWVLYRKIPFSI